MKRYSCLIAAGLLLAAVSPLQTQAANNTWIGASGAFWDTSTSGNWASPSVWADGNNAIFDGSGGALINQNSAVAVSSLTFKTSGRFITNGVIGNGLTLSGAAPSITNNAAHTAVASSLDGTAGVTFRGNGDITLLGNLTGGKGTVAGVNGDGNHYTGPTYIHSGTVILQVTNPVTSALNVLRSGQWALSSIDALDTGATVRLGTTADTNGNVTSAPLGQLPYQTCNLNLTGGTLDLNGDGGLNRLPAPQGTGLILNSSPYASATLKLGLYPNGSTRTFAGTIADGGVANETNGGYYVSIDITEGSGTWILAGSNSLSGSIRINNNLTVQLGNPNALPKCNSSTRLNPTDRIYGALDLNGFSPIRGDLSRNGTIYNSAPATLSVLTLGTGGTGDNWSGKLTDNLGTGGQLGLTLNETDTNVTQQLSGGLNDYSGPTTVSNGVLSILQAPSPNSPIHLFTKGGILDLSTGGAQSPVPALYIDEQLQPAGIYSSANVSSITGSGSLVVGSAPFIWNNAQGNFAWDLTSTNWTGTNWVDGNGAWFGPAGTGTVVLSNSVAVTSLTFHSNGRVINSPAIGTDITLAGSSPMISNDGASTSLAASLDGTAGVTFQGNGDITLLGNLTGGKGTVAGLNGDGNHYTGPTYIHSGTVILQVTNPVTSALNVLRSGQWALSSIDALDTGATVRLGTMADTNGNVTSAPLGQLPYQTCNLNLTGGTLDLNGDGGLNRLPAPQGTGLILNSSPYASATLKLGLYPNGSTRTFAGTIADGGVANETNGGYYVSIDITEGSGTWILAGSNSLSGSIRINNNLTVQLGNPNALPKCNSSTRLNPTDRIYGALDLNGFSPIRGDLSRNGTIYNSAPATLSVLTLGTGGTGDNWSGKLTDNLGTGGQLGLTLNETDTNVTQQLSGGLNDYSGPTTVSNGVLSILQAPSPNSPIHLFTKGGILDLSTGGAQSPVPALYIDEQLQPAGIYSSANVSSITGSGSLVVSGSTAKPRISFTKSGGNLVFSWPGGSTTSGATVGYKLQSRTNLLGGTWSDIIGGDTIPVNVPVDATKKSMFFRLAPLP